MKQLTLTAILLGCSHLAFAQTELSSDSVAPVGKVQKLYGKVTSYFDSVRVRGLDPRYIDMPKHPWQVMIQGSFEQTDLKMHSTLDGSQVPIAEPGEAIDWNPRILTKVNTSVGAWVGYRGHGVGYAVNVGGDKSKSFTLTSTGKFYSLNFRYHTFETNKPEVKAKMTYKDDDTGLFETVSQKDKYDLFNPIKARTIYLNGFYIFNYKKFSYAAARRQAVIQKLSAGSPIVGVSFFHSKYNYANDLDCDFVMMMSKVGCIRQWQANVIAGYSYNWVPAKGWLVNATLMPSLTVYDKIKLSLYDSEFSRKMFSDDPQYENYTYEDAFWNSSDDLTLESLGHKSHHGRIRVNLDARATVAYQWSRYFVSANAQFDTFSYRHNTGKGRIIDWAAKASFGVRF